MSGIAIKNISPIKLNDIYYTFINFQEKILIPLQISNLNVCLLGSTGKKEISGDLDIAINYKLATSITNNKEVLAELIVNEAQKYNWQTNNRINTGFSMVHIGLPIITKNFKDTGKICQLDLMFVSDLSYAKFKYAAPTKLESKYNGAIRSMLLNAFIKEASLKCPASANLEDKQPYIVNSKLISPYIKYSFYSLGPEQIQFNVKTYRGKKGFLINPKKIKEESKECGVDVNKLINKLFKENSSTSIHNDYNVFSINSFEILWKYLIEANFNDKTLLDRIVKTFIRLFNGANSWQYNKNNMLLLPNEIKRYCNEHNITIIDNSTSSN